MKQYKYTGIFEIGEGKFYELEVRCNGFLQAFFLLTADAIRSGKCYHLYKIIDEKGNQKIVDSIERCNALFM